LSVPIEEFLHQIARRGSLFGGGSAAALTAALSAALLEKLVTAPRVSRRLRRIRQECLTLTLRDAQVFGRVIAASRRKHHAVFARALKQAVDVPWQVFGHAQSVQAACAAARRLVKIRFQSDLRCASAIARAAQDSARVLILTNLAWLNNPAYSRAMRRRLAAAVRRTAR
jgi:formiminotetrahydrofolate cyclodeaminase